MVEKKENRLTDGQEIFEKDTLKNYSAQAEAHTTENTENGDLTAKEGIYSENSVAKPGRKRGVTAASYIAKTAMFTALAFVLYLVRISLPFLFAPWLELNFPDISALIGGFALGPAAGVIITVLRVLLKVLMQGTSSGFAGELGDIIISISFVLPAALVYKFNKSKKGALIGILVGAACSVISAMLVNRFVLIPFYAKTIGFPALVGSLKALFKNVTEENFYAYYIFLSVLPFNLLRCALCGGVTFFLYKRVSKLLKMF